FFMRSEFAGTDSLESLVHRMKETLPASARVRVAPTGDRRIVVLVTKEHHCLGELLMLHAFGELGASILAVVGNHPDLEPLAKQFDIPFRHVGHEGLSRPEHEALLGAAISEFD